MTISGLTGRIRADLPSRDPRAAYIGASNDDSPEFYDLFVAATELMGVSHCHRAPARLTGEDRVFLEDANLLLLGGGEVERFPSLVKKIIRRL